MKYMVLIHYPVYLWDLKNWGKDLDQVTLRARHPEAFLTSEGKPILFDSVEEAKADGEKMIQRLPPLKYVFSIINVRGS